MIDYTDVSSVLLPQMKLHELEVISRYLTKQLLAAERNQNYARVRQLLVKKLNVVEMELRRTPR